MITQDIKVLLSSQDYPFKENKITQNMLQEIDQILIDESDNITPETFGIYRKFLPMKSDIPEAQTAELFTALKNYIKEKSEKNEFADAFLLYRFWIIKAKMPPNLYMEMAELLVKVSKEDFAKELAKIYEAAETNLPLKYLTLANFYNLILKEYKTAIKYYELYLKIDETKSVIYTILGSLYQKAYGELSLKDQIYYYEKAYRLKPNDRLILHSLAFGYEKAGDKTKANQFYEELLKNNPTETDYYNYGAFLINCGDFINGHKYFTHRFNINDVNLKYPVSEEIEKKWNFKTDLSDKTLLIHYEQGFGDTFMYCRFIPQMKQLAKKLIFVVQDELFDLIKNSPIISDGIEVITKNELQNTNYDYNMALLDTPYVLKTKAENLPYTSSYLEVEEKDIQAFAKTNLKKGNNLKIGIAYHGNKNSNYNGRDVDFSRFQKLFEITGVDFYSFSKEKENDNRINYLDEALTDFTKTALALKNMDLVITTDNVILNLAGALGIKTIGLFNKHPNYRWFKTTGKDVGWYKSVKPMQAEENDCWLELFEEIQNNIKQLTQK